MCSVTDDILTTIDKRKAKKMIGLLLEQIKTIVRMALITIVAIVTQNISLSIFSPLR